MARVGEEAMRLEGSRRARHFAKQLRREMTPPEIALWLALRSNEAGLRFRKQKAAGEYVLDFYCAPAKLVIEVDGEAHSRGDRPERDSVRDAWLEAQEVPTLRFAAAEVVRNLPGVMHQIVAVALERKGTFET